MHLSAAKITELTGGILPQSGGWYATGICIDSRTLQKGDLFVALRGERFDGHNYAQKALKAGASGVLVEKPIPDAPQDRQIIVPDTLTAIGDIARTMRTDFAGKTIALTGSAGKTSTRELLKATLAHFGETYATGKNYNNHIGVPLTLCHLPPAADYGVFELAMSAEGEISGLTAMTRPDIALVTNIYPMHIEFFESLEGIAHAKAEIFEGLGPDGVAIYNADANHADVLAQKTKDLGIKNVLTFGREGDIKLLDTREESGKTHVDVNAAGEDLTFTLSSPGAHMVYNAMAVLSVVVALGLDPRKAALYLDEVGLLEGRGMTHIVPCASGHFTLIDESYSGQPEAMKLALENLANTNPKGDGRRIAVLGYMAELGKQSEAEHRGVGQKAATAKLDVVYGVGEDIKPLLEEAEKTAETHYRKDITGLGQHLLQDVLKDGDVLLVKGSHHGSKVHQLVAKLLAKR